MIKAEGGYPNIQSAVECNRLFGDEVVISVPIEADLIPLSQVMPIQLSATSDHEPRIDGGGSCRRVWPQDRCSPRRRDDWFCSQPSWDALLHPQVALRFLWESASSSPGTK